MKKAEITTSNTKPSNARIFSLDNYCPLVVAKKMSEVLSTKKIERRDARVFEGVREEEKDYQGDAFAKRM